MVIINIVAIVIFVVIVTIVHHFRIEPEIACKNFFQVKDGC